MDEVYLEIFSLGDTSLMPIESFLTLFVTKYCNSKVNIAFVQTDKPSGEQGYNVDVSSFNYNVLNSEDVPQLASSCELPIYVENTKSCIAGLCATLRRIIQHTLAKDPTHSCRELLGFKESCLLACSEASIWTRFCEVDVINALKFSTDEAQESQNLPAFLPRFEFHMSQPVRVHNRHKYTMSKKFSVDGLICKDPKILPEHVFAEGNSLTLADVIIFVCVQAFLNLTSKEKVLELLPLTAKWLGTMLEKETIRMTLSCLSSAKDVRFSSCQSYSLPEVKNESLYKSDPKRYKPRNRIYTRQDDIENSLHVIKNSAISRLEKPLGVAFAHEETFDWSTVPVDASPEGGSLPASRLMRKFEQLENLCKPVLKLAKTNDTIVDFCSGGGHLGILIAFLLPNCNIILLENKAQSMKKAKERVERLGLKNVTFCQCNVDYFKGNFDIGMSLHACGVATDLVIQHCIDRNAAFICCPCCYGSVQDCHKILYPRSDVFKSVIDNRSYLVIGHAADQTHDAENAKTQQGFECMALIDTDRRLQAEEHGYKVFLGKLLPETCSLKNNLLVGLPDLPCRRYLKDRCIESKPAACA